MKPTNGTQPPAPADLCPDCVGARFTEVFPGAIAVRPCRTCGGAGFYDAGQHQKIGG